jgi:hypothetical protein
MPPKHRAGAGIGAAAFRPSQGRTRSAGCDSFTSATRVRKKLRRAPPPACCRSPGRLRRTRVRRVAAVYRLIARVRSRQLSSRAATGSRRRGGRERGGPGLGGLVQIGLEFRCIRSRRRSNPCGTPGGVCPSTLAGPMRPPSLGEDRSLPSDDRGDAAPGTEPASGSRAGSIVNIGNQERAVAACRAVGWDRKTRLLHGKYHALIQLGVAGAPDELHFAEIAGFGQ